MIGGGFFQHRDRFGPFDFTSYEGAFTAGGGVRGWVTDRVYALADVRFGWELHARVNAGLGSGCRVGGSVEQNPTYRARAPRYFTNSTTIGSSDTTTIPSATNEKLFLTTGTLPNRYPAPMQIPTQAMAPVTL